MTKLAYANSRSLEVPWQNLYEVTCGAMQTIHAGWETLDEIEIEEKPGHLFKPHDLCTSVDKAVQAYFDRELPNRFPGFQLVCEERDWIVPSGPYATGDAVDGTNEFVRGDMARVSTMTSFRQDDQVIGASVGVPITGEVFLFGTDLEPSLILDGACVPLSLRRGIRSNSNTVLLRRQVTAFSRVIRDMLFGFDILPDERGSLGVWASRLWYGECVIGVLSTGSEATPWDSTPVFGMSERLGFVFLRVTEDGKALKPCPPEYPVSVYERPYEIVMIHQEDLSLIQPFLRD
jgi:hypothetical protein